jgi:hypothetical protein
MTNKVPGWFYKKDRSPFIWYGLKIGAGRAIRLSTKITSIVLATADKRQLLRGSKDQGRRRPVAKRGQQIIPFARGSVLVEGQKDRWMLAMAGIKNHEGIWQV